jgi:O-antigen/teichoic acid export membrane protein
MEPRARVLKNASTLLLNQAIMVVSSFAITIPMARIWGAERFGRYAFAMAFAELFAFSFDWGLNWLLSREVARQRERVALYVNNALGLTIPLSLMTMALLVLAVNLLGYGSETKLAVVLSGAWLLLEVLASLWVKGAFHAFERMEYETAPLLAERALAVILGLLVVLTRRGLIALLTVLVATKVLKLALSILIYRWRIARPGVAFDWSFWKHLIRAAFPFGLTLAFGVLYARVDIALLSVLTGDEAEIGFFRAARAATMYFPSLSIALTNAMFPLMSSLFVSRPDSFAHNYRRSVQVLFALGLPIAVGLLLLGDRLIDVVYGPHFAPSVASLRVLSLSVLLKFIHGNLAMVLTSGNRQGLRTSFLAIAALASITFNYLLIPWRGALGASIASVLTDFLLLVALYVSVSRLLGDVPLVATFARPLPAALAMTGSVLLLRNASLLLLIPVGAVTYVAVLYALGGLPRELLAVLMRQLPALRRRGT